MREDKFRLRHFDRSNYFHRKAPQTLTREKFLLILQYGTRGICLFGTFAKIFLTQLFERAPYPRRICLLNSTRQDHRCIGFTKTSS
jgi:hypothetical protein